ncbi:MAG TPA: hypothetical protein VF421_00630 [Niabella sp.]
MSKYSNFIDYAIDFIINKNEKGSREIFIGSGLPRYFLPRNGNNYEKNGYCKVLLAVTASP